MWFSSDLNESSKLNYDECLKKINKILQICSQRSLSWKGRIMIIKTLILAQVVHLFMTSFTPREFLVQLDKTIFNFLWNKKPARVKRETIIAPVESVCFSRGEKIVFLKNLLVEDGKCLNLFLKVCNFGKVILDHKLLSNVMNNYTILSSISRIYRHGSKLKINPRRTYQTF